jgi:hypothetical protein
MIQEVKQSASNEFWPIPIKSFKFFPFLQGLLLVLLTTLFLLVIDQPLYNWLISDIGSLVSYFTAYNYAENNGIIILFWIASLFLLLTLFLKRPFTSRFLSLEKGSEINHDATALARYTRANGLKLAIPFFLTTYYLMLRCQFTGLQIEGFEFTSFQNDSKAGLKHLDILPFLSGIWFFQSVYIFCFRRSLPHKTSVLENDSPITHSDDDSFNLKSLAESLTNEINVWSDHKASFTIGLSGKWGSGKTSLLNLLKYELNNNKTNIVFDFNAWQYETEINLSAPFLKELHLRLKPYTLNAGKSIDNYIHEVLQSNNSFFTSITKTFSNEKSVDELIGIIQHDIIASGKRFIVFIDDLDRLQFKEIMEILNIIRNVGNLPNTVFILAYDKDYIINQLNEQKLDRPFEYFTKFIQLEIPVGKIIQDKLVEKLKGSINKHFENLFYNPKNQKLTDKYADSQLTFEAFLNDSKVMNHLTSFRDVKRLINALIIQWDLKKEKVEFKELLVLEIIRLKYPTVYESLKHNRQIILSEDNLYLFYLEKDDPSKTKLDSQVSHLVTFLFPYGVRPKSKKSIRFKRYYENYFTLDFVKDIRDEVDQIIYEKQI